MKEYFIFAAALLSLNCASPADAPEVQSESAALSEAHRGDSRNETEIKTLLTRYKEALNSSDVDGVVQLYTQDSVLLPQETPTVVGIQAVEAFYRSTFQAISLDLQFNIAEIQVVSPEWAFLRSNSSGTIKIVANGAEVPSSNQELFVLHKVHNQWKFARYGFSSVLKPAQ